MVDTTSSPQFPGDLVTVLVEAARRPPSDRGPQLTRRQREVLQLVAEGKTMKEISAQLHISTRTAESYKYHLMDVLAVRTGAELVQYAIKIGLITVKPFGTAACFSLSMFASTWPQQKERQEEVSARAVSPDPDSGLLQSLIEALPDPCVVVDTGGRVLAVNRKWKELPRSHETASAARNPIGINYPALFKSSTHDQDWESVVTALKSVLSGYCEHVEHEYLRPTPNPFLWFRMSIRAWRQLGASALIFHRDITTEKLGPLTTRTVEQELRTLADSSPVLI